MKYIIPICCFLFSSCNSPKPEPTHFAVGGFSSDTSLCDTSTALLDSLNKFAVGDSSTHKALIPNCDTTVRHRSTVLVDSLNKKEVHNLYVSLSNNKNIKITTVISLDTVLLNIDNIITQDVFFYTGNKLLRRLSVDAIKQLPKKNKHTKWELVVIVPLTINCEDVLNLGFYLANGEPTYDYFCNTDGKLLFIQKRFMEDSELLLAKYNLEKANHCLEKDSNSVGKEISVF